MKQALLLIALHAIVSCADSGKPELEFSSPLSGMTLNEHVTFSVKNVGEKSAFLGTCFNSSPLIHTEKKRGDLWEYYNPGYCLSDNRWIKVRPNDLYVDSAYFESVGLYRFSISYTDEKKSEWREIYSEAFSVE